MEQRSNQVPSITAAGPFGDFTRFPLTEREQAIDHQLCGRSDHNRHSSRVK
jgi:hypothetical protein